jgi:hypothetical protein
MGYWPTDPAAIENAFASRRKVRTAPRRPGGHSPSGVGTKALWALKPPVNGTHAAVLYPLRPLHAQVSLPAGAVIPDGMTESRLDETQEARPSGEDPMEARNRLTVQWWLAPLLLIAIAALIVLIKLLF